MEIGSKRKYKSPNYKLVDCFHKSRDGWKKKAQEAKRTVRKLKERLKKVRARRDYWKELAQQRSPVEPRETLKKAASRRRCQWSASDCPPSRSFLPHPMLPMNRAARLL